MKLIKNLLKKLRAKLYHNRDNKIYYGEYIGSINFWRLVKWNILYFEKILFSIKNLQIKLINYFINNFKIRKIKDTFVREKLKFINDNGFIVLENYFDENIIDKIIKDNETIIANLKSQKGNENSYHRFRGVPLTDNLIKIWLDENIIDIMENYLNTKLYSRMYPSINYTYCSDERNSKEIHIKKIKEKVASYWHVDYSNTISVTVFLSDVDISKTRMQVVPKSHFNLNTFFKISDEAIEESKKPIVDCVGKKGTVLIHCGNIIHKFKGVSSSDRLQLTSVFSSGTNLALNVSHISSCLSKNFDIDSLDSRRRNLIKGIFPISIRQGYEMKNDKIFPTSYKGL
jgi:hypothetical protein